MHNPILCVIIACLSATQPSVEYLHVSVDFYNGFASVTNIIGLKGWSGEFNVTVCVDRRSMSMLEVLVNGEQAEYRTIEMEGATSFLIPFEGDGEISISFVSDYLVGKALDMWSISYRVRVEIPSREVTATVRLPALSALTSFNTTGSLRVFHSTDYLTLMVYDSTRETLDFTFFFTREPTIENLLFEFLPLIGAAGLAFLAGLIIALKMRKPALDTALELLPRNEAFIVRLLEEAGPMTQSDIQRAMKIPKSSLSRILESMEERGVIKRIPHGGSKLVMPGPKVKKIKGR